MIARFRAWRERRRAPIVEFGQTVRVQVHGCHYYMRMSELTIDRYSGASATLRPVSDRITTA